MQSYKINPYIRLPEKVPTLYPDNDGEWYKAEEVDEILEDQAEKVQFLIDALLNLKYCNSKLTTPEQLNDYVDRVTQGYL